MKKFVRLLNMVALLFLANTFGIIIIFLFTVQRVEYMIVDLYSGIISRSNNGVTLDQSIANIILPRFDV